MKRRSLRQQMERKCVHFNGLQNATCRVGCVYDEMDAGRKIAYRSALPCFQPDDGERQKLTEKGIEQATCEHRRFPTEEEIAAREKEIADHMTKMALALEIIDAIRKEQKGKNWRGVLECPNCKGKLHVSHAACNGHVHAKCETEDCVAWME